MTKNPCGLSLQQTIGPNEPRQNIEIMKTLKDTAFEVIVNDSPVWFILGLALLVIMVRVLHDGHFGRLKILWPSLYLGAGALMFCILGYWANERGNLFWFQFLILLSALVSFGACCGMIMTIVTSKDHTKDL